jgi:high-affinity iron transporter
MINYLTGIFSLIACIMIFVMGITMLRMDRAKLKWKRKLEKAFDNISNKPGSMDVDSSIWEDMKFWKTNKNAASDAKWEKWALVILPAITVLREGLEAVVFVGGVSWFLYISFSIETQTIRPVVRFLLVNRRLLFLLLPLSA